MWAMIEKLRMCAFSDGMEATGSYHRNLWKSTNGSGMVSAMRPPRTLLAVIALASTALAEGPAAAVAAPPPAAEEIKRVLDYQENGKERGPALLDVIPCAKVDSTKGTATSYTCVEPITAAIKKGAVVNVWTQWFCPKGGKYEDLSIQSLLDGQVRNTVDITVEGLARTRTWRPFTVSKAGKWQFKVMQGSKELGMTSVVVE